jgi:hypothetical protein
MAPKKKKPPLHVSLQRIEAERVHRAIRTQKRIAMLLGNAHHIDHEDEHVVESNGRQNYSINITCFCVLLVIMNLLFLQWLYYKVHNFKQL